MDSLASLAVALVRNSTQLAPDSEDVSNWELVGFSMIIVTPSTTL